LKIQKVENRKNLFLLLKKKETKEEKKIMKSQKENEEKGDIERKCELDNIYVLCN